MDPIGSGASCRIELVVPLLKGVRVLEISAVVMGPYAGQILADLGAEVVKIEPLEGDIARASHPRASGMGALYANNNRNKKVIALDLKSSQGRRVVERLIGRSDVLLHNMRHDAAERIGIGFERAAKLNPQLIYCSATGFGRGGRYRDRPAYDDIIQAASGLAALSMEPGSNPSFVPTILADKVGALHAVYGILAALVARAHGRTEAIRVEVPMFEALVSFILNEHLAGASFEKDGSVGYPRVLSAERRPHRTRDGWIAVLPYTMPQWQRFLKEIGRAEICDEDWFRDSAQRQARIDELYGVLAAALPARTTAEWIERLSEIDVPCSQVNRLADLLLDSHLEDVDFFGIGSRYPDHIWRTLPQPVLFEGVDREEDEPPHHLGQDTRAILRACDFDEREIARMVAIGAVSEAA